MISGFSETPGDFMYVAINFMASTHQITSVADDGVDSFSAVAGEFANDQSVAFYDVPSESGGAVTITVTLSAVEFGSCTVGQLSSGTTVGVVGAGNRYGERRRFDCDERRHARALAAFGLVWGHSPDGFGYGDALQR